MDLFCKKYADLLIFFLLFIKQCPLKVMFGNKWGLTNVGAKLLSDVVIFSMLFYEIPHEPIWVF